ncbi:DNA-binding response regulator [Bacillus sp. Y1]|nr:response regulator [Bacillus sp. Y1]AYA74420.1 DNA-binding response regulator [Bacillus sp. Y1]
MRKAVIFDDEFIVLKGLERMINWSEYDVELVGTAADGEEALKIFYEHRPDIVFTDIRMPGKDGLQVIEEILKEASETQCIVFSGFNEFDYVKKALRLGVVDYLEKPITIPIIKEALEKTLSRITQQETVNSLKDNNQKERLEKETLHLLLGKGDVLQWRELFDQGEKTLEGVTVLALSSPVQLPEPINGHRMIPLPNGIENLLVLCHLVKEEESLWATLRKWSEEVGVTVGSGKTYSNLLDINKSYHEALHALRYAQFMNELDWYRFEDIGEHPSYTTDLSKHEQAVMFHIRTGDKEGLLEQLNTLISQIESRRLHPDVIERDILKLVYLGLEVLKETGFDPNKTWPNYMPHLDIRKRQTKEDMFAWVFDQLEKIMDASINIRSTYKHEAVERACSFIQANFTRDLTLQDVSEHVGMNATYLSLLFKEEMGESYIKYLTQLRMEKAKQLLAEGKKVAEVSELVGYHSYRHFSELFKKHVGIKPGQFKEIK